MQTVHPIPALHDNYIWMIIHPVNKTCVVIDPGEAAPVLSALKTHSLTLSGIFITHHHWDHTDGIDGILQKHTCPVFGPYSQHIPQITEPLKDGEIIHHEIDLTFSIIETPGHTKDHICYYTKGMLFSGDTLFTAGCGRVFEGTPKQMLLSLKKLSALPDDTNLYCGHEYTENNLLFSKQVEPNNNKIIQRLQHTQALRNARKPTVPSTLGLEKQTNPFLRSHIVEVKENAERHAGRALHTPIDVFTEIRLWKDAW